MEESNALIEQRRAKRHHPEFTMVEANQAFRDYETMMELVEEMITRI